MDTPSANLVDRYCSGRGRVGRKIKTVLITGSSRGLGKSLAFRFASEGCNIILHGRSESRLKVTQYAIRGKRVSCDMVNGDLRSEETIQQLTDLAEERDLDILINNAGIYMNKTFADMKVSDIRDVIETNLMAPILMTHKIFPIFQKKKAGLIVSINSVAGKQGSAGETAYCASKYGLRGFTEALQFDAGRDNIRVVEIYPGAMNTDMAEGRKDLGNCINVDEMADLIFKTCEEYSSMRICTVEVKRRNYG